jgi:hypothetical protein
VGYPGLPHVVGDLIYEVVAGQKANQALLALETGEPRAPVFVPAAQ